MESKKKKKKKKEEKNKKEEEEDMPIHKTLLGLLILMPSVMSFASSDAPTAYDLLEEYSFPRGILPEGVESYLLTSDGSFDLYLREECEFKVQGGSYVLRYKRKISGVLEPGALKKLHGVSVKLLFLWFGIDEVVRTGDSLEFRVGLLSATFPSDNFEDCPRCRCGFDCASGSVLDS